MDLERIISGLKHCVEDNCIGCPYQNTITDCCEDLLTDVLKCIEKFKHLIKE